MFPQLPRHVVLAGFVAAFVLGAPGPAAAHIEVSADGAQAGSGPVIVRFVAESESSSAGIVGLVTQLPAGIDPAGVSLAAGPAGWTLTLTADGFQVAGPDIGVGVDAEYRVSVPMLPADATELSFKTVQRYADGSENAWIELPSATVPEPEQPAPVLVVAPAAATAVPSEASPSPSEPTPSTAAAVPTTTGVPASESAGSSGVGVLAGSLAAVGAVGAGVAIWWMRRSRSG